MYRSNKFQICSIVMCFFTIVLSAQNDSLVDHLKNQIKEAKTDSLSVQYKLELAREVRKYNIDTSRIIVRDVLKTIEDKKLSSFYFQQKKAKAYTNIGLYDTYQAQYENALSNYLKALDISEQIQDSSRISSVYHNLGTFYRKQKEYEKSKMYLKKAIRIRQQLGNMKSLALSNNILGITYYYNRENDSALYYYLKAKELYLTKEDKIRVGESIAAVYFTQGDYSNAIPIYKESIGLHSKFNNHIGISIAKSNLARVYSELGKPEKALKNIDEAIALMVPLKNDSRLLDFYKLRSYINEQAGYNMEALKDYKIFKSYSDSVNNVQKAKRVTALELNHKFEKQKLTDSIQFVERQKIEKAQVLQEASTKFWKVTSIITGIFGLIIAFAIIILRRRKEQVKFGELKNEMLHNEIKYKQKDISDFALNISRNQKLRGQLLVHIKKLKKINAVKNDVNFKALEKTVSDRAIIDNNNISFQNKVDIINTAFYEKLQNEFPALSKTEVKLCSLIRLNIDNNEIAILQNVAIESVYTSRFRIRKKLNLSSDDDLNAFLNKF